MADLAVWQRTIVDEEGNVIPGAEIEVRREEDDSLATLYADRAGETPLANPLAADMSGFVRFFAQGDAYTITAVGAGSTRTWRFDPTGRLQEFDRVSEALVADDAADLLSARANLGTFSSVADVQNSHIPAVLESIRTFGRNAPGDGPPLDLVRGAEVPGAVQSADGQWWENPRYRTVTVRIPTDFPSYQAAIDALSDFRPIPGVVIDLVGESGWEIDAPIFVQGCDLRHIWISHEDTECAVAHSLTGDNFILGYNAVLPVINILLDVRGQIYRPLQAQRQSTIYINPGKGVRNADYGGIYLNTGSMGQISGSIVSGAGHTGLWVTRGSRCVMNNMDISNVGWNAMRFSRSSVGYGEACDISDAGEYFIYTTRYSIASVHNSDFDGARGGFVANNSDIFVGDSTISGIREEGLVAMRTGRIGATSCTITADPAAESTDGARAEIGGSISAENAVFVGFKRISLRATRSASISSQNVEITCGAGGTGIRAEEASRIDAVNGKIYNANIGIFAAMSDVHFANGLVQDSTAPAVISNSLSRVNVQGASCKSQGAVDLQVGTGGIIQATGCETTQGSPSIDDTNISAFNTLAQRGTIFAPPPPEP